MSKKSKPAGIKWLAKVEEHDYPAAQSYLLLIYDKKQVKKLVALLKAAEVTQFKSKDIFRASGLSLLGISNSHVEKDSKKIRDGKALSPLLLVRDPAHGKVIIADGYHRLCSIYGFDEDALIHCKIV
jgi:disulfide oxidoreductase YuzD